MNLLSDCIDGMNAQRTFDASVTWTKLLGPAYSPVCKTSPCRNSSKGPGFFPPPLALLILKALNSILWLGRKLQERSERVCLGRKSWWIATLRVAVGLRILLHTWRTERELIGSCLSVKGNELVYVALHSCWRDNGSSQYFRSIALREALAAEPINAWLFWIIIVTFTDHLATACKTLPTPSAQLSQCSRVRDQSRIRFNH